MQLCLCVTDTIIQHYVRCIESDGLHVEYLVFLQTVVKSEGQFLRKCQDIVMQEVRRGEERGEEEEGGGEQGSRGGR